MPVPQALIRGQDQSVADTRLVEGHLRNRLALALWLAVKVVLVCVFVFSFGLSIVETGLWFYQQRYVLRKGPSSRTWLTMCCFLVDTIEKLYYAPQISAEQIPFLFSSVTCGHSKL